MLDLDYDGWGYAAAVLCAFFSALAIVLMRKCKDVHFSIILLHFGLWSFKFSVGLVLFHGSLVISGGSLINANLHQWILAVVVAVAGLAGTILLVRALNLESAGKVAVVRSLEIVMAYIVQVQNFSPRH
jgi:drug/metabolite transporter (DMT)-like permease